MPGSRDVDHRLYDGGTARFGKVVDETAVDLDLVEGEALQIAQRRVPGAEIIERNPHDDGAKMLKDL